MTSHSKSAPSNPQENASPESAGAPRRNVLIAAITVALGAIVSLLPFGPSLMVFLDPLRRKKSADRWVRIATKEAAPDDGQIRRFKVIDIREDAWNLYPPEPIGAVFVRWDKEAEKPRVWTDVCPHLGCAVSFKEDQNRYHCPCHNSLFDTSGVRMMPTASPRAMDELTDVKIENEDEIWIIFRRYRGGKTEKIEIV